MKTLIVVSTAVSLFAAVADDTPIVSKVTMTQDASRKVQIDYTLDKPGIVTIDVLTNGVSIGAENIRSKDVGTALYGHSQLTGDIYRYVEAGDHTIYWSPHKTWPGHVVEDGSVSVVVTAWSPSAPPDCLVVDLDNKLDPVRYYPSEEWIPGGFVSNDVYKTSKIVFRKIPAANVQWRFGDDCNYKYYRYVTLTEDYYMAVYELTYAQYGKLVTHASRDGHDLWPIGDVTFNAFRGAAKSGDAYDWPNEGHKVDPNSFLGLIRKHCGGALEFDLPTIAQWQFAARSGNSSRFCTGSDWVDGLDDYAWYEPNSSNSMHDVGLKLPNQFGLYDVHGNAMEWALDWYCTHEQTMGLPSVDPVGFEKSADPTWCPKCRKTCGGYYANGWRGITSSSMTENDVDNNWGAYYRGFRLVCPARHIVR